MQLSEYAPRVAILKDRPAAGPKGRKNIARGEAPGMETKDNQPRRGDRKGRTKWLGLMLLFIIGLNTKTKHPASPSGLVLFYCLYRGLHPPLYPVGLSGLTLKFLYNQGINNHHKTLIYVALNVSPDGLFFLILLLTYTLCYPPGQANSPQ